MTHIDSLEEAEKALTQYIPLTRIVMGRDITLGRMKLIMDALGNPQRSLKIIHVAGTSGKTSTTYYTAALLTQAGYRTGVTVSPHMDSITERLQVDGKPVKDQEFCSALEEVIEIIKTAEIEPTYFELLVALAYWYFAKAKVDYAVIETGLGGLHDGTNVASNPDKVCVITDIGYDHMHILGQTLSEIATQKAGIIHPKNYVLMYRQPDVVIGVIQDWCRKQGAELHFHEQPELEAEFPEPTLLDPLPQFQKHNFLLAHQTYLAVQKKDKLKELSVQNLNRASLTNVPGRMDQRTILGKTIVMDGAHNEQKMHALVSSFARLYPKAKIPVLLSIKDGKEYDELLPILLPITSTLILTSFNQTQDIPSKSISTVKLASHAREAGFQEVITENDQDSAFQILLAQESKLVLITGSLYLLAQLRHIHKELRYEA